MESCLEACLVDLDRYRELSQPEFGETGTSPVEVALPVPVADGGDETVAESLQPSGKRALAQPRQPGWNLVSASLAAGIPVEALPEAITATFLNIAPENSQQAEGLKAVLGAAIATRPLDPAALGAGQLKFLTGVQRQVQNSRRGIFVWNFESYDEVDQPPADFGAPISTLYSVAAGLKTNWILQTHGFDENTRVVYFDYSQQALAFKQLLHEEWNGEDYPEFLRYLFTKLKPGEVFYQLWGGFSPQDMAWDTMQDAWTREIARWGGESVIREHWRRAKQLRVDYVLCNVLEDQGPLLREMDNRPSSVIWWSNVFFTFYSNWFHSIDQTARDLRAVHSRPDRAEPQYARVRQRLQQHRRQCDPCRGVFAGVFRHRGELPGAEKVCGLNRADSPPSGRVYRAKGPLQVADDVRGIFEADGEPNRSLLAARGWPHRQNSFRGGKVAAFWRGIPTRGLREFQN